MAADPVEVASNVYTTLFENERVRLLEVRLAKGDSSAMHGHPDYVVYNLDGGKVRFSSPSGETEEVELPAGAAMWRGGGGDKTGGRRGGGEGGTRGGADHLKKKKKKNDEQ